jgi:hypothetical protein
MPITVAESVILDGVVRTKALVNTCRQGGVIRPTPAQIARRNR